MNNKTIKTEPIRPFCLSFSDAKGEVFGSINAVMQKHGIPLYLMESILTEALYQVRDGANKELQTAKASYQAQIEELSKTGKEDA